MVQETTVKIVENMGEIAAIKTLRVRVFVEEQGVPLDEEFDEHDDCAAHAIALIDGKTVGTGRIFTTSNDEAYIGRMAVDRKYRRLGIASKILTTLEKSAMDMGVENIKLHAQTYVQGFYERHGYAIQGEPFIEVEIEHVLMTKALKIKREDS